MSEPGVYLVWKVDEREVRLLGFDRPSTLHAGTAPISKQNLTHGTYPVVEHFRLFPMPTESSPNSQAAEQQAHQPAHAGATRKRQETCNRMAGLLQLFALPYLVQGEYERRLDA
jgi:hypothetical protein